MRFILAIIVFAACATTGAPATTSPHGTVAQADDAGSATVCKEETPVGTNISRVVCREPDPWNPRDEAGVMHDMEIPHPLGGPAM